jgi:hypothetical protein
MGSNSAILRTGGPGGLDSTAPFCAIKKYGATNIIKTIIKMSLCFFIIPPDTHALIITEQAGY